MKNFRILLMALIVFTTYQNSQANVLYGSDETLLEEIITAADSLENALESRNYKAAKEQLDILFPLLKKEMKLAKKEVQELKKNGSEEEVDELESAFKRKTEIHDSLHAMVDASIAGLRVKANDVKALVNEYVELLETKDQLLSANQ